MGMQGQSKFTRRAKMATTSLVAVTMLGTLGAVVALDPAGAVSPNAKYTVALSGANEVPPTTDVRTGTATVLVKGKISRVCVLIKKVGPNDKAGVPPGQVPIAAHIHQAPVGVDGPIVIPLNTPVLTGKKYMKSKTCADGVAADLMTALKNTPNQFYVNVHTGDNSGGALRGQLAP